MYELIFIFRSLVVLGQGCVLLSIMIKECKGRPDDKFIDFQASPAENTGDRLGADRPGTLVRSEAVEFTASRMKTSTLVWRKMDRFNPDWPLLMKTLILRSHTIVIRNKIDLSRFNMES